MWLPCVTRSDGLRYSGSLSRRILTQAAIFLLHIVAHPVPLLLRSPGHIRKYVTSFTHCKNTTCAHAISQNFSVCSFCLRSVPNTDRLLGIKRGGSLRRGKDLLLDRSFSSSSSLDLYWEQSLFIKNLLLIIVFLLHYCRAIIAQCCNISSAIHQVKAFFITLFESG